MENVMGIESIHPPGKKTKHFVFPCLMEWRRYVPFSPSMTPSEIHSLPSIYSAYKRRPGLDRLRGEFSRNKNRSPRRSFQIPRWPYQPHIPNLRQKGRRCRRSCHPEPAQLSPMEKPYRLLNYKPANWSDIHPEFFDEDGAYAGYYICTSLFHSRFSTLAKNHQLHLDQPYITPGILDFRPTTILHRLPRRAMVQDNRPSLPKRRRLYLFTFITKKYGWPFIDALAAQKVIWVPPPSTLPKTTPPPPFPHLRTLGLPLLHFLHRLCRRRQLHAQLGQLRVMAPNRRDISIHPRPGDREIVHELPAERRASGNRGGR
jgi:hypothetical protein